MIYNTQVTILCTYNFIIQSLFNITTIKIGITKYPINLLNVHVITNPMPIQIFYCDTTLIILTGQNTRITSNQLYALNNFSFSISSKAFNNFLTYDTQLTLLCINNITLQLLY